MRPESTQVVWRLYQYLDHRKHKLSSSAELLTRVIMSWLPDGETTARPTMSDLLEDSGFKSPQTINKALAELQRLLIIRVIEKPGKKPGIIRWLVCCPTNCKLDHYGSGA